MSSVINRAYALLIVLGVAALALVSGALLAAPLLIAMAVRR